jgi:hypothetical protein
VLFENLLVTPAPRPIELSYERLPLFDPNLVNAILIAVERKSAAIAAKSLAFNGIDNEAGGKSLKRVRAIYHSFPSPEFKTTVS